MIFLKNQVNMYLDKYKIKQELTEYLFNVYRRHSLHTLSIEVLEF